MSRTLVPGPVTVTVTASDAPRNSAPGRVRRANLPVQSKGWNESDSLISSGAL